MRPGNSTHSVHRLSNRSSPRSPPPPLALAKRVGSKKSWLDLTNSSMDLPTRAKLSAQFAFFLLLLCCSSCIAQQPYIDNKQNDCYNYNSPNDSSSTQGYTCNGARSCSTFLVFRSSAAYGTPVLIASLLAANASNISRLNEIANDGTSFPEDRLVLVPLPCSCSGAYYQHNASYTLMSNDTYFSVANNTYQGLTTCQALMAQNPYDSRHLQAGQQVEVPIRCACPTAEQARSGVRYLLTYLIASGDDPSTIVARFRANLTAVLNANNITSDHTIYPYTTFLLPLPTEPTKDEVATTPAPPPPPPSSTAQPEGSSSSGKRGVIIGVGSGVGVLLLVFAGGLIWFMCRRRRRSLTDQSLVHKTAEFSAESYSEMRDKMPESKNSISIDGIRCTVESLAVYEFRELEAATGRFSEDHRIAGSVYRGIINGDAAAVKRLKGDVSNEINILKQINHNNLIRLSGFCLHEGNSFLVYEFAENGSLDDWLHRYKDGSRVLNWRQRVQIAHDVADGLNYMHNYANPPYVHQNLKSSNILLEREMRAKIANFGLARPVDSESPHLTKHVVGTQGYMAPEYLEHGLITPKLDVFAFGVVMLELLSGKEATFAKEGGEKGETLLWAAIAAVMSGEDARRKFADFVDDSLQSDYPVDLAYAMAELATRCVAREPGARPSMGEVIVALTAIYDSTLDWDPSDVTDSGSIAHSYGR